MKGKEDLAQNECEIALNLLKNQFDIKTEEKLKNLITKLDNINRKQ